PFKATTRVNDGSWHHVAATISADSIIMFVDGVAEGQYAMPTGTLNANAQAEVWIGRRADQPDEQQFEGALDELRYYGTALPAEEVAALANVAASPVVCVDPAGSLVGTWSLDGCSDLGLSDADGAYTGTLVGGAQWGAGYSGQGLAFTAPEQRMALYDSLWSPGPGEALSYSFWVNPSANARRQWLVMREEGTNSVFISLNNLRPAVFLGGVTNTWVESATAIPLNSWTHIGVSYGYGTLTLYVNGAAVRTIEGLSGNLVFTESGTHWLGAKADGTQGLVGRMDEFRLHRAGLTAP
ncbi:MAG TPA: hypothetical protein DCP28_08195, partial [Cytophagales bacterium]|nr:hypothetical protein [Cytophagales bacterium]